MGRNEGGHVLDVGIRTDGGRRPVIIGYVIVAPNDLMIVLHAPGPEVALKLAGFRVHQRLGEAVGVTGVTLAAGFVGNHVRAGIGIEGVGTAKLGQLGQGALVGALGRGRVGRAAVADYTTGRIAEVGAHGLDLLDHGAVGEAFDSFMAGQTALFRRNTCLDGLQRGVLCSRNCRMAHQDRHHREEEPLHPNLHLIRGRCGGTSCTTPGSESH